MINLLYIYGIEITISVWDLFYHSTVYQMSANKLCVFIRIR